MTPMAANLSNAEMNELAAYFSNRNRRPLHTSPPPENAAAGATSPSSTTACSAMVPRSSACSTSAARGPAVRLLESSVARLRAKTRADFDGNMTSAGELLSEKDIEILADYLSGLNATPRLMRAPFLREGCNAAG